MSLGYGISTSDGSGIGDVLGRRLLETASEIVEMGVSDPAIFEILGLLEEDFGPDRLSDMTISIIRDDLFRYSSRVAKALHLRKLITVKTQTGRYRLPKGPDPKKPLVFVPSGVLRRLPVAQSWEEIGDVISFNQALRNKLNNIINKAWKKGIGVLKRRFREVLLASPEDLKELLRGYNQYHGRAYDLHSDPEGLLSWFELGQRFANKFPVSLFLNSAPTIQEIENTVEAIVVQFKKLIEHNGLNIHLYDPSGKPLHERYSQRLFFSVADSYCKANNVDLSAEPNAGSGPVDFKFSRGYDFRVLGEIKLSTNTQLVHGYEKQLRTYQHAENTDASVYVVLRVANSESAIKRVLQLRDAAVTVRKRAPKLFVIDARRKPAASKRRT